MLRNGLFGVCPLKITDQPIVVRTFSTFQPDIDLSPLLSVFVDFFFSLFNVVDIQWRLT